MDGIGIEIETIDETVIEMMTNVVDEQVESARSRGMRQGLSMESKAVADIPLVGYVKHKL